MIKSLLTVLTSLTITASALACPAGKFVARSTDGIAIATIQGFKILSPGWTEYSKSDTRNEVITRYSKRGL